MWRIGRCVSTGLRQAAHRAACCSFACAKHRIARTEAGYLPSWKVVLKNKFWSHHAACQHQISHSAHIGVCTCSFLNVVAGSTTREVKTGHRTTHRGRSAKSKTGTKTRTHRFCVQFVCQGCSCWRLVSGWRELPAILMRKVFSCEDSVGERTWTSGRTITSGPGIAHEARMGTHTTK